MIRDAFTLEDTTAAVDFGGGYPLGNGEIGAFVMGGAPVNEIRFSHNAFYSGRRPAHPIQPGAAEAFRRMRSAAIRGDLEAVYEEAAGFIGRKEDYGTNLPVGTLSLSYHRRSPSGSTPCRLTSRRLDLREGISERLLDVMPETSGWRLRERCFVSTAARAFVLRAEAVSSDTDSVDLEISWMGGEVTEDAADALSFVTDARETLHCESPCGARLTGRLMITETDGYVRTEQGRLFVTGARFVTILLRMGVSLETAGGMALCEENQKNKPYITLQQEHAETFRTVMTRTTLHLPEDVTAAFLFHYGRYLLYSASQPGSPLPAHLQGVWNDNVACRLGWTCDLHLDVNTQMNYSLSETCNLPETLPPLWRWMREQLIPQGRVTARDAYGLSGWVAELVSNAFGYAAPFWGRALAPCPTCGVWLLTLVWEHYLFTGDQRFLQETAFPMIEEAARFFAEYVYEMDGQVHSGPSVSPENAFLLSDGEKRYISDSPTYEILMIRELFRIYVSASGSLSDTPGEPDRSLLSRVQELLPRLLPYRIAPDGTLAEFSHDYPIADPQHRHTSHLLGLYPFDQITPDGTPALAEAVARTVEAKLTPEEDWEDTGWARNMLLFYADRLRHPEQVARHLRALTDKMMTDNGLIFHPPTRGTETIYGRVYELDGNTGVTAGIAEALLQSHGGILRILPALPPDWRTGEVTGLRARGGYTVDIRWETGNGGPDGTSASQLRWEAHILADHTGTLHLSDGRSYSHRRGEAFFIRGEETCISS